MNKRQKEIYNLSLEDEKKLLHQLEQNYINALADIKIKIKKLEKMPDTQSRAYQIEFQKHLEKEINGYIDILESNNVRNIEEYYRLCYENGFICNAYALQGYNMGVIVPINQDDVINATRMTADGVKLSTKIAGNTALLKKQVVQEIQRGFSVAMPYADIARNISARGQADMNRAMRIARTEGNRIYNTSAADYSKVAKDAGCDIVKQWVAVLDARTRDSHQKVDGEWVEIDSKFSNGLRYPSDRNGRAGEVVNCRCKVAYLPRWYVEKSHKTVRRDNITGELIEAKNFNEWKEKYYKSVENLIKSDILYNSKYYRYLSDTQWNKLISTCKGNETKAEHNQIWRHQSQKSKAGYVQTSNSYNINAALRAGNTSTLKADDIVTIDTLNRVIDRTKLQDCIIADRYCDTNFLKSVFNVEIKNNSIQCIDQAVVQLNGMIGQWATEDAFMSVSLKSSKNVFKDKPIKLKVLLENGTCMYATDNRVESEAILHTGTRYQLLSAKRLTSIKGNSWLELTIKVLK